MWVKRMASTRLMSLASACSRRSVEVSTSTERTPAAKEESTSLSSSRRIDGRVRRSRGSDEWHTPQAHPITGTPCDVPLPRTVTRMSGFDDSFVAALRLDEAHPQLVE